MKYADTVLSIMRTSRQMLLDGWGKAKAVNHKTESAWSIVTQVDLDVEKTTREKLTALYPDIVFVGEENGGDRTAERYWLMDPVDGTAHYARGMPFSTSMLALIERGEVVFGAIYDFLHDDMYWAEKGGGAYRNSEKIKVSDRALKGAFITFESNTDIPVNESLYTHLRDKADVLKTYSAGWEFAMVASGKIEARICVDPFGNDYDYAPGTLLVAEAGGIVTNVGSEEFVLSNLNFIASNPVVHAELTKGNGPFAW